MRARASHSVLSLIKKGKDTNCCSSISLSMFAFAINLEEYFPI